MLQRQVKLWGMNDALFFDALKAARHQIPWENLYRRLEQAAKQKEVDFLERLLAGFVRDASEGKYDVGYPTLEPMIIDSLTRALAPAGVERLAGALLHFALGRKQRGARGPSHDDWESRMWAVIRASAAVAAELGAHSHLSLLAPRAENPILLEFIACCTHEAILRDQPFSEAERETLRAVLTPHPLSWLPLQKTSLEQGLPSVRGLIWSRGMGGAPFPGNQTPLPLGDLQPFEAEPIDVDRTRVAAAYINPRKRYNARVEVARFLLSRGVPMGLALLERLPLHCTGRSSAPDEDGDTWRDDPPLPIYMYQYTPGEALAALFAARYPGRCYEPWPLGAWARLAAWESLGAMVDLPATTTVEEIEEEAVHYQFASFTCSSRWYVQIACDFGLLAQNQPKDIVTILAGTDSD